MDRSPIVCLEGPSAAGKSSLAHTFAAIYGAHVVSELDASAAPPVDSAEPWFTAAHTGRWAEAVRLSACVPLVVLDCDPLKGLWYNWMHAEEGWPDLEIVEPLLRERILQGEMAFPDAYFFLDATEAELWARRNSDPTRARRRFEKHLRKLNLHRAYFRALQSAAPTRVSFFTTHDGTSLAIEAYSYLPQTPTTRSESLKLLDTMAKWIRQERGAA